MRGIVKMTKMNESQCLITLLVPHVKKTTNKRIRFTNGTLQKSCIMHGKVKITIDCKNKKSQEKETYRLYAISFFSPHSDLIAVKEKTIKIVCRIKRTQL